MKEYQNTHLNQDTEYPHVMFRLKNELFSVFGKYVSTIQQYPEDVIQIPHAPSYVRGSFFYQGQTISIVDLRLLFDWQSLEQEFTAFSEMIDQRKNDHINWVRTLEECLTEEKVFPLATDSHKCALGKWRDSFVGKSSSIAHQLQKIDAPHEALHHAAIEVMEYRKKNSSSETETYKKSVMQKLEGTLMPQILSLLDETKDIFRKFEYREMVLVLGGEHPIGLLVDEVVAVDNLVYEKESKLSETMKAKGMILAVQRYEKTKELVLELDVLGIREKVNFEDWAASDI